MFIYTRFSRPTAGRRGPDSSDAAPAPLFSGSVGSGSTITYSPERGMSKALTGGNQPAGGLFPLQMLEKVIKVLWSNPDSVERPLLSPRALRSAAARNAAGE